MKIREVVESTSAANIRGSYEFSKCCLNSVNLRHLTAIRKPTSDDSVVFERPSLIQLYRIYLA